MTSPIRHAGLRAFTLYIVTTQSCDISIVDARRARVYMHTCIYAVYVITTTNNQDTIFAQKS